MYHTYIQMYTISRLDIYRALTIVLNKMNEDEELFIEEEDTYKESVEELRDNDEIDDFEEAFLQGYNEFEDLEKKRSRRK